MFPSPVLHTECVWKDLHLVALLSCAVLSIEAEASKVNSSLSGGGKATESSSPRYLRKEMARFRDSCISIGCLAHFQPFDITFAS